MDKILEDLYHSYTGEKAVPSVDPITGSGSDRRYYRITGKSPACIGVKGESVPENRVFIALAKHFKQKGLPVPEIYAVSEDEKYYLQEDVGNVSLFDLIQSGKKEKNITGYEKEMVLKTIRLLPSFQYKGAEGLDFSVCYPVPVFDERTVFWDLNYFKYCFLKPSGIDFLEPGLENDFEKLSVKLTEETGNTFLYRDFQSRNVMIKDGAPYFIDFQGGRKGPVYYDLASFVWQAKADFSEEDRLMLIDVYLSELQKFGTVDRDHFYTVLNHFVLFRTLQVLGAYGFRGYFEKKPHFLQSIPFALNNVCGLLKQGFPEYPCLSELLTRLIAEQSGKTEKITHPSRLTVRISSFSYKKGIPEDPSGNGGGFVFDCRAIHNPGRYDQFKPLTGLDAPVKAFLEKDGEIFLFLEHVFGLAESSVQRYIERDFTHLMFSFGCTGGQHRSVYTAQKLAEHLHQMFDVRIELFHREQDIQFILESKK
ncbi:MAG: phosphotransferase [Candidatus Azobacteroides sp.]|nr:phosphotransferase [Candidatus Azobacteroides sp.]